MAEILFPFQEIGAQWLASKHRALLADEMGLGKTCQAIAACDAIGATRILVLCPAVARFNWMREFEKFSTHERTISLLLPGNTGTVNGCGLVICSYNSLTSKKSCLPILLQPWDVVILDEVHYLKNRKAGRTVRAFQLAEKAGRVFALSGTPAPNHAGELWPLLHFFKGYEKDYWTFVRRFCVCVESVYGTTIKGSRRIPELRSLLAPIMLRRKKEDVMTQLPPIFYSNVIVEAGPVDKEMWFRELCGTTIERFDQKLAEQNAAIDAVISCLGTGEGGLQALAPLQVKCTESRRYVGLQKTGAVAEMVAQELKDSAYEKIVLFAIHRDVIHDLMGRLKDFHPVSIYGGTPPEKRDKHLINFNKGVRCRVMIANIQAAGTAISLTGAHQVGFVEASWVPAENAQAAMRCHRIGQTKPVTVRFFSLANSSDERVQKVLCRKAKETTAIIDGEPETILDPFAD